ncbi:Lipopolysaccharide biosynthesis protein WzxC [Salmonella enterica subsp. arizonae]|uniref:Lipopolysaccharide biosynthesis protein WzxC n=1 Tax=Salmonella enterica subsp. arizonae TaxID=59203 RepID=A0A2X4T626_SALER|nr:Lipopolysaccharide biosynthesis protein WzxC [Salmonella enterica subsp. arizonae]
MLFPAFAKIQDDTEKLRVNFYKLLSVVGIINFPALLGLMVVANNFVPLVFGEKWNSIIPILQLLCVVGLLRSVGNPIGSLLMAKARVDISFKFNVFKTFLFIPAILIGGHLAGAIGVTLGFLMVQIINTILSYFVMIKPVLGSSYRQYILSLWLPFYLTLPTLAVSYGLGIVLRGHFSIGVVLVTQIAVGALALIVMIIVSRHPLVVEMKRQFCRSEKMKTLLRARLSPPIFCRMAAYVFFGLRFEVFMKLLILGNHTCGNRGDSAILRGLLDAINHFQTEAQVDVMSRYPVSSSWLLNRPVMGDPLFLQMKQHNSAAGVMGRVKKVFRRRYQHQVLLSRVTDTGKLRNIAIAQGFTDFVRLLSGYDAIIQVGGSFFVDLYGAPQFEHALCTFMAKKATVYDRPQRRAVSGGAV